MYIDCPQEDQDGTKHVGGYNDFDGVVNDSEEDGLLSYQQLKARSKGHVESLMFESQSSGIYLSILIILVRTYMCVYLFIEKK